jgi:TonB family protein
MTTSCPAVLVPTPTPRQDTRVWPVTSTSTDSWRYTRSRVSRTQILGAALISVILHATLFFGIGRSVKKPTVVKEERVIALTLAIPNLKDLEEPEPLPSDDAIGVTDLATLVPMQADLPQLPRPNDFVQTINFNSLLEKPDFSNVSVTVIPETFRGGRKIAESIGKVFNLDDLDRIPEPLIQHAPLYPVALRRDAISGKVHVQFVVSTDGRVIDAHVTETSHPGFNDAAVAAVKKWKFRAGMKSGQKVHTRMAVPIVFSIEDGLP